MLHDSRVALPRPVLKRWHLDPTQRGLLLNAGHECAPLASALVLGLVLQLASFSSAVTFHDEPSQAAL